jgi:hypothetical protein
VIEPEEGRLVTEKKNGDQRVGLDFGPNCDELKQQDADDTTNNSHQQVTKQQQGKREPTRVEFGV